MSMISGIGNPCSDPGVVVLNNLLIDISKSQLDMTQKLLELSVTEQVEASQIGLGENVDSLA
jgi:hypothetical protein